MPKKTAPVYKGYLNHGVGLFLFIIILFTNTIFLSLLFHLVILFPCLFACLHALPLILYLTTPVPSIFSLNNGFEQPVIVCSAQELPS